MCDVSQHAHARNICMYVYIFLNMCTCNSPKRVRSSYAERKVFITRSDQISNVLHGDGGSDVSRSSHWRVHWIHYIVDEHVCWSSFRIYIALDYVITYVCCSIDAVCIGWDSLNSRLNFSAMFTMTVFKHATNALSISNINACRSPS